MRKLFLASVLGLAALVLQADRSVAGFFCHHCCCHCFRVKVCCSQYNAFSPPCCSICGCFPFPGAGWAQQGGHGDGCAGGDGMCEGGGCAPPGSSSTGCCDQGSLPPPGSGGPVVPPPPVKSGTVMPDTVSTPGVGLAPLPSGQGGFVPPPPTPMPAMSYYGPPQGYPPVQAANYQQGHYPDPYGQVALNPAMLNPYYANPYFPYAQMGFGYMPGYSPVMAPTAAPNYWYGGR
jgi:hypothetical protein